MRKLWPYRAATGLIALALCYLATTLALASAERRQRPHVALRASPFDAQALAGSAYALLQVDQSPEAVEKARRMALRAVVREPVNVAALRTLGIVSAMRGDSVGAKARFALVERLSRRDLATQLWWIEYEVERKSVTGALTYFDEALRTSPRSSEILIPILVQAVEDASITTALSSLLKERPSYFRPFFIQASDNTPNIGPLAALGMKLLNRRDPDDQDLINRIILRFGRDKKYDEAWRMFTWANVRAPTDYVVNGDFDHPTPFRLFNWNPTDSDSVTAEVAPREGSNSFYLVARIGRGLAARQLLRLPIGRYELSAVVGDVPDAPIDRPTVSILCASDDKPLLTPVQFPPAPKKNTALRARFNVGSTCRYQWLSLQASASSEDETRAWIDDIRIQPVQLH